MTAAPRKALRRGLTVLLVLLAVAGWTYQAVGDRWKDNVVFFTLDEGDNYRLRVTGSFDVRCAKLERETFTDPYVNWREAGKDCVWPAVAGGDGRLAGGRVEQVHSERLGKRLRPVQLGGLGRPATRRDRTPAGGRGHDRERDVVGGTRPGTDLG